MSPRPSTHAANPARRVLLIAAGYFLCASAALQLTRFNGGVAVTWLAGALVFSQLMVTPRRRWRGIAAACVLAGTVAASLFGFGYPSALPMASISVGEACAAAWLLKRLCPRFGRFHSVKETVRFLLIAGVLAPGVGACAAAGIAHLAVGLDYAAAWRDWFAGHALGFVVFSPPLILAFRGETRRWLRSAGRRDAIEALGLLGAVAGAAIVTFGQDAIPLVALPLVPMVATTFRLGRFGAVASMLIFVTVAMAFTLAGFGPTTLLHGGMTLKLQVLQVHFATVVLILLPVAAGLEARQRLLDRLRATEALHRLILESSSDVVLRLGTDGSIKYISPLVKDAWGYSAGELAGRSFYDLVVEEDEPTLRQARSGVLGHGEAATSVEYRLRRADGTIIWVESHIRATADDRGQTSGTVSIIREVTEYRRTVENLARQAATDPLTGVANRRTFDDALATRLSGATRGRELGCVAIFDLDHFKNVNDRYGHQAGDAVLVRFASVLRDSVRDGDVVARLGGEEFAVLLFQARLDQAYAVCERVRIRQEASEMRSGSGEIIRTTVSVGLARLGFDDTAEQVVSHADAALYRAKETGRNRLSLAA